MEIIKYEDVSSMKTRSMLFIQNSDVLPVIVCIENGIYGPTL